MTMFHTKKMSQKTRVLCSKRMLFIVTLTFSFCQMFITSTEAATNDKLASISIKNILSRNYNTSTPRSSIVQKNVTSQNIIEKVNTDIYKIISNVSSENKTKKIDANKKLELSTVKDEGENNNNKNVKTFVSLTADCRSKTNSSVLLHLHTSEPFFGWIYTRDHQATCSQRGTGLTMTTLVVKPDMDCGLKMVEKMEAEQAIKYQRQVRKQDIERVEEIALYVQHDEYVQQVIDEQFLVHCKEGQPHASVSYQKDNPMAKTIDQVVFKSIATEPVKEEMIVAGSKKTKQSGDAGSESSEDPIKNQNVNFQQRFGIAFGDNTEIEVQDDVITIDNDDITATMVNSDIIEGGTNNILKMGREGEEVAGWKPVAVLRHRDMIDFHTQPISGWMELTSALTSEVIEDRPVIVGQQVNLVIRLRQTRDRDTLVSSCEVHGERGTEEEERQRRRGQRGFYPHQINENSPTQDLTDYRGCSLEPEVMPNFAAAFNSMTGVKKLTTTFPVFKFPARSKLTFRCSVLVCRKNCPVAKCDSNNPDSSTSPQQEFLNVKIMEKFMVETSVEVAEKGKYPDFFEKESRRYYEPASRPDFDSDHSDSNLLHQTSTLQLDVGTKIIGGARKASQPEQLEIPPEKNDDNSAVPIEEDQLCLSPSRLVLGFGILLVILLLALVASCMMWMRARSYSRRPKPTAILSPRPPQRVQMSPGGVATRVATPMGTGNTGSTATLVSARPYFVAPRYIRVMH